MAAHNDTAHTRRAIKRRSASCQAISVSVDGETHALSLRRIGEAARRCATLSIKWGQPVSEQQGPFGFIKGYIAPSNAVIADDAREGASGEPAQQAVQRVALNAESARYCADVHDTTR